MCGIDSFFSSAGKKETKKKQKLLMEYCMISDES